MVDSISSTPNESFSADLHEKVPNVRFGDNPKHATTRSDYLLSSSESPPDRLSPPKVSSRGRRRHSGFLSKQTLGVWHALGRIRPRCHPIAVHNSHTRRCHSSFLQIPALSDDRTGDESNSADFWLPQILRTSLTRSPQPFPRVK